MQLKAAQDRFRLSPPCSALLGNTPWLKDWFASTRVSAVLLGPVPVIPCQGTGEPRAPSCHQGAVGAARLPGAGLSVLSTPRHRCEQCHDAPSGGWGREEVPGHSMSTQGKWSRQFNLSKC